MRPPTVLKLDNSSGSVAVSGVRIVRLLSAELFREAADLRGSGHVSAMAEACHDRWTDLAAALIALPEPVETLMLLGSPRDGDGARRDAVVAFLAVGRGPDDEAAQRACNRAFQDLWTLLITTLDYAEFRPIEEEALLQRVIGCLSFPHVLEFRRHFEAIPVSHGLIVPPASNVGFAKDGAGDDGEILIDHVSSWVPSDDSWRRLLEALSYEPDGAWLLVHARGYGVAPPSAAGAAMQAMAASERVARGLLETDDRFKTVLEQATMALRQDLLHRMAILRRGVLAARTFLVSPGPPSAGLVATVLGSLDDVSSRPNQSGAEALFRGGADLNHVEPEEILAPFVDPSLNLLFGPREATAMWRTPMPSDEDLPGLPVNRARTAAFVGESGDDCAIGTNLHRGVQIPIALDQSGRFRHTYIVGQTGTGKSTLLLHMILHDISQGRGVAVLDPHGPLIEDLLDRIPSERVDDVILVDVSDIERPVGFNILRIEETDPLRYRAARDYLIDDIYGVLHRIYDLSPNAG